MEEQKPERNYYRGGGQKKISPEEIIADIKATAAALNMTDYISSKKYFKHGKHSITAVWKYFGSWKGALLKAGMEDKNKQRTSNSITYSDDELIADMQRVAEKFSESGKLTVKLYAQHGICKPSSIASRFGGWRKALVKAGTQPKKPADYIYPTKKTPPTEDELITAMNKVASQYSDGVFITQTLFEKYGICSVHTLTKHFGSWQNALLKSGLKNIYKSDRIITIRPEQNSLVTDEELIKDILLVAKTIAGNALLLKSVYNKNGKYSPYFVAKRFGTWSEALKKANLQVYEGNNNPATADDVIKDIQLVAKKLKVKHLTVLKYLKHGLYHTTVIYKKFKTWNEALKQAGLSVKRKNSGVTNEELLQLVKEVAKKHKVSKFTATQFEKWSKETNGIYYSRFGSWNNVLEAAGLNIMEKLSEEDIIFDIQQVAMDLNRQTLLQGTYTKYGKYTLAQVQRFFYLWEDALDAAGLRIY